jgi:hypothetical protein
VAGAALFAAAWFVAGWRMHPQEVVTRVVVAPATPAADEQPVHAPLGTATLTASIDRIDTYMDNGTLNLKLVEWTGGDAAEQSAFEDGSCTLESIENEECTPDGYHIRRSEKRFTLRLAKDAQIFVIPSMHQDEELRKSADAESGGTQPVRVTLKKLRQLFQDESSGPILTYNVTVIGDAITKLEERYQP